MKYTRIHEFEVRIHEFEVSLIFNWNKTEMNKINPNKMIKITEKIPQKFTQTTA